MLRVKLAAALLFGSMAFGCASAAPPPPPPPPPAPAPPPPPPPPPPVVEAPKCASLGEKCVAIAETKLAIPDSTVSFHPPDGWTYAIENAMALAVAPNEKAVVGFMVAGGDKPPALADALEKLFERLAIQGVVKKRLRTRLKKAQHQIKAAGGPLRLWEVDKKSQKGKAIQLRGQGTGTLLVVVGAIGGKRVVGCGFVVKPDGEAEAAAIMQAVQSLETPAGIRMEEI